MAIDPEIRQAIEELRVLVLEAYRASGAIDRAASSGARTGERTSVDPGMARAGVASGAPAGAVPGYMAVAGVASGYGFNRQVIRDEMARRLNEASAMSDPQAAITNDPDGFWKRADRIEKWHSQFPNSGSSMDIQNYQFGPGHTQTRMRRQWRGHTWTEPWLSASMSSSEIHAVLRASSNTGGAITNRAAYPSLLSEMQRNAGKVAGSVGNLMSNPKFAVSMAILGQAAIDLDRGWADINATEFDTNRDIAELKRQRLLSPALENNMRELNALSASNARQKLVTGKIQEVANFGATTWVAGKAFAGRSLMAGARAAPMALYAYIAVKGALRGYDVLSGNDAARVEEKLLSIKTSFQQQFLYEMSRSTQERMLKRFTETAVLRKGMGEYILQKGTNLFGLLGDSEEAYQDEAMALIQAEVKRQNPKIAEARASLRFGDVYMAQRKFDKAADALHLKNDVPFMWRNPQGWFMSHESSRVASRNWASSQMSRAKIRTGD